MYLQAWVTDRRPGRLVPVARTTRGRTPTLHRRPARAPGRSTTPAVRVAVWMAVATSVGVICVLRYVRPRRRPPALGDERAARFWGDEE
jgi:hypothetical protein